MELKLYGHNDLYAIEQLQMSLFPLSPEGEAVTRLSRGKTWLTAVTQITLGGKTTRAVRRIKAAEETVRLRRQALQQSYYLAARQHLGEDNPWGALAGVRPTKLTTRLLLEGCSENQARRRMEKTYYVTPGRARLAVSCSQASVKAVKLAQEKDISLYVGIPFCPTRCSYCSFVSRTIGKRTELLEPYLQALHQEIVHTAVLLKESGYGVRTVYIGGGTPTSLSAKQLSMLLAAIRENFDLSHCIEFTVEAGRPDTLDEEKLLAIKNGGADRISINPQSLQDGVLKACGRPHTGDDIRRLYQVARNVGFSAINMDLIAGLPTDDPEGFRKSLDGVIALGPENITVHTLALKKGADLFEKRQNLPTQEQVAQMVAYAEEKLTKAGYTPYYLYRQKYMSGSFENVGWSKPQKDCLYNIYMMEELHSIVSLGGGGMSKLNLPGGKVERYPNPKFPEEYIDRIGKVLSEKDELIDRMKGSE